MAFGQTLARLRQDRGMTQEELAARVYVTRQAISRWETGETTPGIDMCKLLAVTLDVPIHCLLEMPEYPQCQSCGMPLAGAADRGTEADGSPSPDYCTHCYQGGRFSYDATMDQLIEWSAPILAQHSGMSLDEAVSFMGAQLPALKRWRVVQENDECYGAEVREKYGAEVVDAANAKMLSMSDYDWRDMNALEEDIKAALRELAPTGDPASLAAQQMCAMHAAWVQRHWPEGAYSKAAHLGLAQGYLADERFTAYYDGAAGKGATQFLVDALTIYLGE